MIQYLNILEKAENIKEIIIIFQNMQYKELMEITIGIFEDCFLEIKKINELKVIAIIKKIKNLTIKFFLLK